MSKKPLKRVIPEYDYKPATVVIPDDVPTSANTPEPEVTAPVEISGDQFAGLDAFVEIDSTKYSSDTFDIATPSGDESKEE